MIAIQFPPKFYHLSCMLSCSLCLTTFLGAAFFFGTAVFLGAAFFGASFLSGTAAFFLGATFFGTTAFFVAVFFGAAFVAFFAPPTSFLVVFVLSAPVPLSACQAVVWIRVCEAEKHRGRGGTTLARLLERDNVLTERQRRPEARRSIVANDKVVLVCF